MNVPEGNQDEELTNLKRLRHLQTLVMIGLIGGPVSLLIGGFPLSIAGLVCAMVAFYNLGKEGSRHKDPGTIERRLYVQAIAAIAICTLALVLNFFMFLNLLSGLMEAAESGALDSYLDSVMGGSQNASSGSIWSR